MASEVQHGEWSVEDGSLAAALRKFAEAHRISGDRIFTVLSRHEATLRLLELPSNSEEELEGMVRLCAEEIVPFPADELVTGYCILEALEEDSSRVLAAVVHRDVIEAHLEVLKAAGITPEQVYLSTTCLFAAAASLEGTSALVNVEPGGLEVVVLAEGRVPYGRGIATQHAWAGPELSDVEQEELVREVRASLATQARESVTEGAIETVLLSSGALDAEAIARGVGDSFGPACRAATELARASIADGDSLSGVPLVALGAAISASRKGVPSVGLLPKVELQRREAVSSRARLFRVAAMVTLAALAASGVYVQAVTQRTAYIAELSAMAESLRPLAQSVRAKRQQLRYLQVHVERSVSPLELLAGVAKLAPEKGLNLTRYTYDAERGIVLQGRALKSSSFDRFIDDLRGASTFKQFALAQETYRTLRKERNREVWDFAISIPFELVEASDE